MSSWAVHATVDEPVELLCAFFAHYLAMGASEVHLCLDRPAEEVMDTLNGIDGVRLTRCDASYWAGTRTGLRPDYHVVRQETNANRAFRSSRHDWFLFCDADEFLHLEPRLGDLLDVVRPDVDFVRLETAERAFHAGVEPASIFDGLFRARGRIAGAGAAGLPDEDAPYYSVDAGFLGQSLGKTLSRVGRPLSIRVLCAAPLGSPLTIQMLASYPKYRNFLPGAHLAHFDGLTPLHWVLKLLKKSASLPTDPGRDAPRARQTDVRRRQMQAVFEARTDAAELQKLLRLLHVDATTLERLRARGRIADIHLDPVSEAMRLFPEASLDFSVATFDARLRRQYAALIEQNGFAL